jgi:hypothetical protein
VGGDYIAFKSAHSEQTAGAVNIWANGCAYGLGLLNILASGKLTEYISQRLCEDGI